jgi:DNA polymerase-3 subunit epsilon
MRKQKCKNFTVTALDSLATKDKPIFPVIWEKLHGSFTSTLLVAHKANFDISALNASIRYHGLTPPQFNCECTYQLTGLKLTALCEALEIELPKHHNALFDALACAHAYIKIKNGTKPNLSLIKGDGLENLFAGHEKIAGDLLKPNLEIDDKNNPFYNKKIVFTGVLDKISRQDAAKIVKAMGADIDTGITRNTNYVIVGHGAGPSKLGKIEDFNSKGANITIITETDFWGIIKHVC